LESNNVEFSRHVSTISYQSRFPNWFIRARIPLLDNIVGRA
jgi:hypothetical protein